MEINNMTINDIETRSAEIRSEMEQADADLEALAEEARNLELRKLALKAEAEARAKQAEEIAKGNLGESIEEHKEREKMSDMEIRKSHEYNVAYANYLKTGDDKECRALLSELATDGTVPVAAYVEGRVRTAWEKNEILNRVRKTNVKGILKVAYEISSSEAVAHAEGAEVSEEALQLGIATLTPESIKKWISVSDEALDLTGEEFLDYLYNELTYHITKKLADIVVADIAASDLAATASAAASGAVAAGLAAISDDAAEPVIMMNKTTWKAFETARANQSYAFDLYYGLPVIFNNKIANNTILVGDLGYGYQINLPNGDGVALKFDDKTLMTSDMVRVLGRIFAGHAVVAKNAFAKVTITA